MTDPVSSGAVATVDSTSPAAVTTTLTVNSDEQDVPTVRLKLKKPKNCKKVQWTSGTVDNENMNKKKSKCCCIYNRKKDIDDSESDEDDECEHCQGHVELRKKSKPAETINVIQPIEDTRPVVE